MHAIHALCDNAVPLMVMSMEIGSTKNSEVKEDGLMKLVVNGEEQSTLPVAMFSWNG